MFLQVKNAYSFLCVPHRKKCILSYWNDDVANLKKEK